MNTSLNRIKQLALLGFLTLISLPVLSQGRRDTVPVYNSDIIRQYGRSITMPVNEKVRIQTKIKQLVDSCLIAMTLREESSEQYDPMTMEKFKSYFDEQVLIKDINAIPNFFQPRSCLDSTVFPDYYPVQAYIDSAQQWLVYMEFDMASEIVAHDFFYKFRGDHYTYAQVDVEFTAPTGLQCNDSRLYKTFKLNFWFKMSKQKYITESGEAAPIQYKIRFLEIQPIIDSILAPPPQYRNRWSFLNLAVHGGVSSAAFKALSDYNSLSIEPAGTYGVLGSYTLFASDTFTVFDKVRLWEYGLDLGVGYDHVAWNWKLDSYENLANDQTVSPLNNLVCNHDLLTEVQSLAQKETFDILSVPLSFTLKRYFSPGKINSVMLKAGVSFNYLLGNSTEITSGTISYTGQDCAFQDPDSQQWIEGVTIDNLPYYGFGTFDAALTSTKIEDMYEPYYLAGHLKLAFDLRQDRYARLHWIIAPYFNYSFTEFRSGNSPDQIIEPGGNMTDLSAAITSLKPYSFGLEIGIAYNIIPNGLKNVRIRK